MKYLVFSAIGFVTVVYLWNKWHERTPPVSPIELQVRRQSDDISGTALSGLALIGGVALLAGALSGSASAFHNGSTSRRYGSYSDDDDDDGDIWSSSPSSSTRNYNRTTGFGGSSPCVTRQSLPSTTTSYYPTQQRSYTTPTTTTTATGSAKKSGSMGITSYGSRDTLPSTSTTYKTNAPTQTGNRPFTSTNEQSHVGEWQNGVCGDDTESNSDYYILPCYYDGENWIYPHEYAYHDEGLEWAPRRRVDNNSQKNTDNVPPTSNNPRSNARKTTDYDSPSSTIEKSTAQPKTETAPPISTNEMRNEQKKPENVSSTSSNRKRNRRKKRKNASSASSAIKANEQRKTDSVSSISIDSKKASESEETRDPSGSNLQLVKSTAEEERVAPQRKSHTCQHTITGWDYIDTKINQLIDNILDGYTELGEEDHGPMHQLIVDNLCDLTELLKSVDWAEKITGLIKALAEKRMMANRNMLTEKKSDRTCRLFVGNLGTRVTSGTLKAYFARYAEIEKACVECNEMTQRSKGYGFVECATFEDAEKVFDCAPHYVDGRRVTVRYARPDGFDREKASKNSLRTGYALKVRSVPTYADHYDVLRTFSQFGSIADVSKEPTGGCFQIVFGTREGRQRAWEEREHRVCNQTVQCSLDDTFDQLDWPIQTGILGVGGVLSGLTQWDLRDYFSRFGDVEKVRVVDGSCYLKFSSWMDVEHVMAFNGSLCCKGNYLTVTRILDFTAIMCGVPDFL